MSAASFDVIAALAVLGGLARNPRNRIVSTLDRSSVTPDARLRTDTVGEGEFAPPATFVLVDAENTGAEGAYVTLAAGSPMPRARPSAS